MKILTQTAPSSSLEGGGTMRDYELVEAIEKVVATHGEVLTDGECLDKIIELVEEYKSFNPREV